jgi:hypothetical protein
MNKKSGAAKIKSWVEFNAGKSKKQRRGKIKIVLAVENKIVVF